MCFRKARSDFSQRPWRVLSSLPAVSSTGDVQISDKITISKNFKENVIRPILKVRVPCPSCWSLELEGITLAIVKMWKPSHLYLPQ